MLHTIIFISPYPTGLAPSQRFRFEQYLKALHDEGYKVTVKPLTEKHEYELLTQKRSALTTVWVLTMASIRRLRLLLHISKYDYVFVHREAFPMGPPVFEWFVSKVFRKKMIYDFDDAIWLTDNTNESPLASFIRCRWKVRMICKWSWKISCGNEFLADYARQFNRNVTIIPTTIDTVHLHNPDLYTHRQESPIIIGWTGSRSTLKYLENLESVLTRIEELYSDVHFLVIADQPPRLNLKRLQFIRWSESQEVQDLLGIDIGIMPLPDDEWARGKCGFKALQYLALKKPAVVSPVGVNKDIVTPQREGYWANTEDEWMSTLIELIHNKQLRDSMGQSGRQKVIDRYSVIANTGNFLSLFQ